MAAVDQLEGHGDGELAGGVPAAVAPVAAVADDLQQLAVEPDAAALVDHVDGALEASGEEDAAPAGEESEISDSTGEVDSAGAEAPAIVLEECPICFDMKDDIQMLVHRGQTVDVSDTTALDGITRTKSGRDTSEHKACSECRKQLVEKGQSCPWCRDEVVWQDIFGFLDGLKQSAQQAQDPNTLADLMSKWQEYELTRSRSDVLVFARDMIEDVALSNHLKRANEEQHGFLRDSCGIWIRFHAMIADGELIVDAESSKNLDNCVNGMLDRFDADAGSAPQYAGAVYAQVAAAYMCAMCSGMSTTALVPICKRIGLAVIKYYGEQKGEVQGLMPKYFCEALSEPVWGGTENDLVLNQFYPDQA